MREHPSSFRCLVVVLLATLFAAPVAAQHAPYCPINVDGRVANVFYEGSRVYFEPLVDYERIVLTVTTPCSIVIREFERGENPVFDVREVVGDLDGTYTWELRVAPIVDPGVRKALEKSREGGDPLTHLTFQQKGLLPEGPLVDSAAFTVLDGIILQPEEEEGRDGKSMASQPPGARFRNSGGMTPTTAADQVIPDDLIVQGSACVGFDCVNNESFSFDTIRMKENNLRIHFDDTSTIAGYPAGDWRIIANDSANGGASKFSVEDSTGAKTPFTLRAGAPSNSMFVDSTGRVGFRTSTPVLDLHVSTSNTPAIRLEQTNAGGFTAQTWDVGANEANFFVRDVTGGSKLSFRIRPGAPTSSVDISADGDVGVGTASPSAHLHVLSSDGSAGKGKIMAQNTSGTAALRTLLELENNGGIQLLYDRTDGQNDWQMSNFGATFQISVPGAATAQFSLNANGDLTIGGTQYLTGSSRDIKEGFEPVDTRSILDRVVALPLTEWSAKGDTQRHIGPIAEEWWDAFGLGPDDKHVALGDISGVALAAIQGLHSVVEAKDAEIAELQARLAALEAVVATIAKTAQ